VRSQPSDTLRERIFEIASTRQSGLVIAPLMIDSAHIKITTALETPAKQLDDDQQRRHRCQVTTRPDHPGCLAFKDDFVAGPFRQLPA
jgi:hypothetical protein